ncbi:hypothetical protein CR513_45794, partial [Mucuna pruriens]
MEKIISSGPNLSRPTSRPEDCTEDATLLNKFIAKDRSTNLSYPSPLFRGDFNDGRHPLRMEASYERGNECIGEE